MVYFMLVVAVLLVGIFCVLGSEQQAARLEQPNLAMMSPEEREKYVADQRAQEADQRAQEAEQQLVFQWGAVNEVMVCPHCQTKGMIRTKAVVQKKGISGGKATAALITGGLSVLVTGLSRKEEATHAHCGRCNNSWLF